MLHGLFDRSDTGLSPPDAGRNAARGGVRGWLAGLRRSWSLRDQLVSTMVALVLATSTLVGLTVYFTLESAIVPEGISQVKGNVSRLASLVARRTNGARQDIFAIAGSGAVQGFVRQAATGGTSELGVAPQVWRRLVEQLFVSEIFAKADYLQLRLINRDGHEVVRVDSGPGRGPPVIVPPEDLQDKSSRDYVARTLAMPPGAAYVSPIEFNEEHGLIQRPLVPVLRVALPLTAPDGSPWGIIILNLSLRLAFDRVREARLADATMYVVNEEGEFLTHPEPRGKFSFALGDTLSTAAEPPGLVEALGGLGAVNPAGKAVSVGRDIVGAAAVRLAGVTPVVVIEVLPDNMATALNAVRLSAVLSAVLAALLAAGVAVIVARLTARPILAMTYGVSIGGDESLLPTDSAGEVGVLARALSDYIKRERWHGAILENSTEAILTTMPNGTITGWNPSAERLFRIPADAAIGLPAEAIVPPERAMAFRSLLQRVIAGDRVKEELTLTLGGPDGEVTDISLRVSPVRTHSGVLMGASIVARDVTDELAARETFRLATEYSPVAQLLVDRNGTILLVNAQLESCFGYPRGELIGRPFDLLVPSPLRERHAQLVEHFLQMPQTRTMGADREVFGCRKDGISIPIEVGLTPVPSRGGLLVLAAIVDMSERRATKDALERRTRELERSNADLTQFAYVASHDMQEPLRSVASFAQLLSDRYRGTLDTRADTYIDFVVDGAKRMQTLINDILAYSRIGSSADGQEPVAMSEVFDEVANQLRDSLAAYGGTIEIEGEPPSVMGNRVQIVRLVQNLVSNAIKYRSEEAPRIVVSFQKNVEQGMWQFAVADNGVGFDETYKHKIFLMFQRLNVEKAARGSGLGLAIAKRIVDQHGGSIWATSAPGKGSTFSFTLPVAP